MNSPEPSGSRDLVWQSSRRPPLLAPVRVPGPSEAAGGISLGRAARGILRWWWQSLAAWVVVSAVLCAAIQVSVKPSYEASSLLRVEPLSLELFGATRAADNSYQNFLETQVQLITSSNVLTAAATGPGAAGMPTIRVAADPEAELRRKVQVKILPKSYLIEVTTTSPSPAEAAAVANAVVDSYLAADSEWSEGMTKNQIKNLEAYRLSLQAQVEERQKAWLELAARGNAPAEPAAGRDPGGEPTKTSISIEEYKRVRSQLLDAQLELAEAEAARDYRRSRATAGAAPEAAPEAAIKAQVVAAFRRDPDVSRMLNEIDQLDAKAARFKRVVRSKDDPALVIVERQAAGLRARYDRLWREKAPALKEQASLYGASPEQTKDASERVVLLKATIASLEGILARLVVADREHSTDSVKSAMVQSDLKRLDEMQSMVDRRLEQLRFEARGQARIRRVSEAREPARPSSDKRPRLLAATPVGVLVLILAAAMLLEVRAGRVGAASDVSRSVGVEAFPIPPLPISGRPRALTRSRTREGLVSEYVDRVAEYVHRMDHVREALCGGLVPGAPGRCVLITSAVGGEGKTTLASQLATRCANAGVSTLLIDCDLRRPSLNRLLDVPEGAGIGDVLRGEAALEDALVPLGQLGCSLLPAGKPEANPARLILGQRLGPLLAQLRRSYDVVIIDSPPVLPVPDALTLGRFVDGAVLAARYDTSRMRLVEQAHRTLTSVGIPVLGVVVNGVRSASHFGGSYTASYTMAQPPIEPR